MTIINSPFVRSLLQSHPNETTRPDRLWASSEWWEWSRDKSRWRSLLNAYIQPNDTNHDIPPPLLDFIRALRLTELDRQPIYMAFDVQGINTKRMSQKKAHEVRRMVGFLHTLLETSSSSTSERARFVDVGAGQGYLSRALAAHFDTDVLALDADSVQTRGAQRTADPRITHKTLLVDPASLQTAIDDWIGQSHSINHVPIVIVALHACGSLTPDVLRAFFTLHAAPNQASQRWYICAVVVVGCCYNLLRPEDFPISKEYSELFSGIEPLPPSSYHLATQTPSRWLDTPLAASAAELAIKKVVWRAALAHMPAVARKCSTGLSHSHLPGRSIRPAHQAPRVDDGVQGEVDICVENAVPFSRIGSGTISAPRPKVNIQNDGDTAWPQDGNGVGSLPSLRRLGRLPDSAYADWATFLSRASERLGVNFLSSMDSALSSDRLSAASAVPGIPESTNGTELPTLTQLETLHVLRCLLGPALESLILRDRLRWVEECLGLPSSDDLHPINVLHDGQSGNDPVSVSLVNLFDQACGSARNVAIVISPRRAVVTDW